MPRGANVDLSIIQGTTFVKSFRWAAEPCIFKPITGLSPTPPATFTVVSHGVPQNWIVSVVSAPWARGLNSSGEPPDTENYHTASVIDADTLSIDFNSAGWKFKTGGFIRYFTPVDLFGYSARMQIRDKIGGTILASLSTEAGSLIIDNDLKMIIMSMTDEMTEAFDWTNGVYDLEVYDNDVNHEIAYGKVNVIKHVTRV